ncbi:MAG: hypothetical protein J2P57_08385 [Acidimicrobiaceae bacterium]|nr:hypothetical protein [Acidimicrobiaceae bacterium]
MQIPIDTSGLQFLVVGEPTPQFNKDGTPRLDRETGRPLWSIPVTLITEDGAETIRLSIPEGGFPKELRPATFIDPARPVIILYGEKVGRSAGHIWGARSVKVTGGLAGVKAAAA